MRNNDERDEFIRNIDNWELSESTIWTQTLKLTYEGHEWYQVRVLEYGHHYDYKEGRPYDGATWESHQRYYKEHPDFGLEPINKTQIIEEIKLIDKELKLNGKDKRK